MSDDAKVRKIVTCVKWVLGHLGDLTAVRTVSQLVVCFKVCQSTCWDSSKDHLSVGLFQGMSVYL